MTYQSTFTYTVDQKFFVEALSGAKHPTNYLDRFPSEVYNTSPDSVLYKFIYTLVGPVGVGSIRKSYLEARLIYEETGLNYSQLENFYANPLGFGKIATEEYTDDVEGLLNKEIWSQVKAKNQAYKNRVIDFFHGARLGSTPEGMRYAAKSAVGQDVLIIENYLNLFDQNSDIILNLDNLGIPSSEGYYNTESFSVIPNAEKSKTVVQTLTFDPYPSDGYFTIYYGNDSNTVTIQYYRTVVSGYIQASGNETTFLDASTGNTLILDSDGNKMVTTAYDIQILLQQISELQNNVRVFGNFKDGFEIRMVNQLANQQIDTFVTSSNLKNTLGYEPGSLDGQTKITVSSNSGVLSANNELAHFDVAAQHNLNLALGQIKPITSYPIYHNGVSQFNQPTISSKMEVYSSSSYSPVTRFVTGDAPGVTWPSTDSIHWIEKDKEIEAPVPNNHFKDNYQDFHEIKKDRIYAYDESALLDPDYNNVISTVSNYVSYSPNTLSTEFVSKFTSLKNFNVFTPENAFANVLRPSTANNIDPYTEVPVAEDSYPTDYFKLSGVSLPKPNNNFWASSPKTMGADYLEIDLGSVQAVNFITLEVLSTPLQMFVAYDKINYGTYREFVNVTPEYMPNTTEKINFNDRAEYLGTGIDQNPWLYKSFLFTDENQNMIFTRFIRIGFNRTITDFLINTDNVSLPWSVCARNLRIGRTV